MTRLVPDPDQLWDHNFNTEGGEPARFIELHRCDCGREFNPLLDDACSSCRAFPLGSKLEAAERNVKKKAGRKPKPWVAPDCRKCGTTLDVLKGSRKTLCPPCLSVIRRAAQETFLAREAAGGVAI